MNNTRSTVCYKCLFLLNKPKGPQLCLEIDLFTAPYLINQEQNPTYMGLQCYHYRFCASHSFKGRYIFCMISKH